jgi:hypothetical protein
MFEADRQGAIFLLRGNRQRLIPQYNYRPSPNLHKPLPCSRQVGAAGRAFGEKVHEAGEEIEEAASRNQTAVYTGA